MLVAHAGALILLATLPFTTTAQLGLAGLILASLGWQSRRGALTVSGELRILTDGSCRLIAGDRQEARRYRIVQAAALAGMVRLRLESSDRRHRMLLVMPDAVDPDDYRQLRALIVQRRLPVSEVKSG